MRRELFNSAGKIDEFNSYEEDRTCIPVDRPGAMHAVFAALRCSPQCSGYVKRSNVTTSLTDLEQRLAQLRVCNRLSCSFASVDSRLWPAPLGYALKRMRRRWRPRRSFPWRFISRPRRWGAAPTFNGLVYGFVALARLSSFYCADAFRWPPQASMKNEKKSPRSSETRAVPFRCEHTHWRPATASNCGKSA